ncbi:MAG: 3-deoxy-7-phosphoheptulonate synthase [Gemmatimonadota bacterium]
MATNRSVPETRNLHVTRFEPLVTPGELLAELPSPPDITRAVAQARGDVRAISQGTDSRLLVVVGPCSIHDPAAALEYARKLATLRQRTAETLYIVMRVYFEKPRTNIGWKGLINDPRLDGSRDMAAGLRVARRLLLEINALELPIATELLGPVVAQYIADQVAWTAIGARTVESQTHREMASGLSMPVGFKNGTDGGLQVALDGMIAAGGPHTFLGLDETGRVAVVHTSGNPDRHLVLRGGGGRTNYDRASVRGATELLGRAGLIPRLMVDCSHGNSAKDHTRQGPVLMDVIGQLVAGSSGVLGVMLESHLNAGSQPLESGDAGLHYGVSITDACIDWSTTESLLLEADQRLRRAGRGLGGGPPPQRRSGT